jgi:hypothetical protein
MMAAGAEEGIVEDLTGPAGFWRFVSLRQAAYWRRKQALPGQPGPPWSDDPAIARFHFCNVYREVDAGTLWFQKRRPRGDARTVIEAALIYRPVNRSSTFEAYGGLPLTDEATQFAQWIRRRLKSGEKGFTGRHQTRAQDYTALCRALRDGAEEVGDAACASHLRDVTEALRRLPGIGPFFSWQVACDALESGALTQSATESALEWALLGPGATAGAKLVLPEEEPLVTARRLADPDDLGASADPEMESPLEAPEAHASYPRYPAALSLKNVEHALCEYARWVRASDPAQSAGLEVKPWAK